MMPPKRGGPPPGGSNHAAIVGNHADLNAANARVAGDHLLRVVGLKLVEVSLVQADTRAGGARCKAVYDPQE